MPHDGGVLDLTVYAIPAFVLTMATEAFVLHRRGEGYELRDTAASLSGGIGSVVVNGAFLGAQTALFAWLYGHRFFDPGTGIAAWVTLTFAEDLCYYAAHRTCHSVRFFWATHVVHHSSRRYTLATALRQSWVQGVVTTIFWLPLPLLGFRPEMILVARSVSLLYQYWIHTEVIRSLGPLEWVLNTPSHHRVHHGSNEQYLDKNHAGIFIVWDRLFGTFVPEGEKVVYGLTKNVGTHHPVAIQFHEFLAIARDVRDARSLGEALSMIFVSPGELAATKARYASERHA